MDTQEKLSTARYTPLRPPGARDEMAFKALCIRSGSHDMAYLPLYARAIMRTNSSLSLARAAMTALTAPGLTAA